jgi:hypothetical protein
MRNMTTYCARIWATIRTCARNALNALEQHKVWHRDFDDPNCGVYRIGNRALHELAIPAEVDSFLRDFVLENHEFKGEAILQIWPTIHALDGLERIARSESRDEAFAEPAPVPPQSSLHHWAIEGQILFDAMRLGGPDSEPDTLLADMYAAEQQVMLRNLVARCAFSVDSWARDLPDCEQAAMVEAWDNIVQDPGALESFQDEAERNWRRTRRFARETLLVIGPHIVWKPLTGEGAVATPSFVLETAAADPRVPAPFRSMLQDCLIGPEKCWLVLHPDPGQILQGLRVLAKSRSKAEALELENTAPNRYLRGYYIDNLGASVAKAVACHSLEVQTAIDLLVKYVDGKASVGAR